MTKKVPTTYSVRYCCSNCSHDFNVKINKGTLAFPFIECENCGNREARPTHRIAEMKGQRGGGVSDITNPDQDISPVIHPLKDGQDEELEPEEDLSHLSAKDREETLKKRAEAKADEVTSSLTSVHENRHPENADPTKRFILIGSNIFNKRKEIIGYVRASDQSWDELKAQFGGKKELQDFLARIKVMPQTLVELYGVNLEECYCLEMLDRRWEHKKRNMPELPQLPALTDGDYAGFKKSLGILD